MVQGTEIKEKEKEKEAETGKKEVKKDGKTEEEKKREEMSEEDQKLQSELELLVERLTESDQSLYKAALEMMRSLIRASTTSMTSVPKPLKFMRPHFETMKTVFEKISDQDTKKFCGDVISALAMTAETGRDCLKYRLLGQKEPIGDWGHEYVRHLANELTEEWKELEEGPKGQKRQELLPLAIDIVKHNMGNNAEAEACDLLMEIERLDILMEYVPDADHSRVCLYLISCVPFAPDPENMELLKAAKDLYLKFGHEIEALRCAIQLNNLDVITKIFLNAKDPLIQKQMAILLGRHQIFLDIPEDMDHSKDLTDLNSNSNLFQHFSTLGIELDIMEPKTPEEIYKTHLEPSKPFGGSTQVDSAKMNLASSFVNGFVNTGFCNDKMVTGSDEANKWFYKNKDMGIFSAAASQGLIFRWDVDGGLSQCDKFLYSTDDNVKAGTMLAVGIISSGIYHECDPAQAILLEYVMHEKPIFRIGAILGLGLAYANSKRESVQEEVIPKLRGVLNDAKCDLEVIGVTGLALGLICVGTADSDVAMHLYQVLLERPEKDLNTMHMRFLALGIGLIYLGKQDQAEVMVESLKALPQPFSSMAGTLVDVCAYAGTGNVLKIQELLHICSEHYEQAKDEKDKKKDSKETKKDDAAKKEETPDLSIQQSVAVLGIALIAMGEDVGCSMNLRIFGSLMRYGEPVIRRAVPLALGLLSVSNPQLMVLETLGKYSHDADHETAYNAILALGLVGGGTNNARLGGMLRQLAVYHGKDQNGLMLVRMAQGLTHLGKGTMTMSPFHSDRQLLCPAMLAGLLTTTFACLDVKNTILGSRQHYLLYGLVPSIQPRHLITFVVDELDVENPLKQVNVSVRVGQAVDVVGQAGKPKTITGFQTHTTPVLLAYGERAELATEEYLSITPYMEGLVILKKNPEYLEDKEKEKKDKK